MSFGLGGGLTPWVQRIIIANVVMYFLHNAMPVLKEQMAFVPHLGYLLYHPWSPITYMFAHGGLMHLLFNMLGLFFFGPPLESRWGSREFLKFYIICGLGGAALSFAFASGSSIIGASAAVYGIMLAFAMNWPDAPIYIYGIFPIKAKYLVGIMFGLSIYSAVSQSNDGVAHFAHLGGFAAGFIYLKFDRKGGGLFTRARRTLTRRKLDVHTGGASGPGTSTGSGRTVPGGARPGPAGVAAVREEQLLTELDRVLDKISTEGMSSLTVQERKLLDEASRRHRQN